jgi:hypothetical protein
MIKLQILWDEFKLLLTGLVLFPLIAIFYLILKIKHDDDE